MSDVLDTNASSAAPNLRPELLSWCEAWKTCLQNVLSQVSGQTATFEISAQPLPTANSDLWYMVVAKGAVHGEMTLRLPAAAGQVNKGAGLRRSARYMAGTPRVHGRSIPCGKGPRLAPGNPGDIFPVDFRANSCGPDISAGPGEKGSENPISVMPAQKAAAEKVKHSAPLQNLS